MIRLTRPDPSRNMNRFHAAQLAPTLFGESALVAEWGRRPRRLWTKASEAKPGGGIALNVL